MIRLLPYLRNLFYMFCSSFDMTCFYCAGPYVNVCHRRDPQLSKCIKESLEKLRPFLETGKKTTTYVVTYYSKYICKKRRIYFDHE